MMAFSGATSDGFSTIVQPAAMAGATLQTIWLIGQFHGVIRPTTPIGSRAISVRALDLLELIGLQHLDHAGQMRGAGAGLEPQRELQRRAHLAREASRRCPDAVCCIRTGWRAADPAAPCAWCGRTTGTRRARRRRRDRRPGAADRDLGERLLGGRIDHVEQGGLQRIDPLAVDVELLFVLHGWIPLGLADAPWQGPPDLRRSLYIDEYNVGKGHRDPAPSAASVATGRPAA